jgi:DNA-binding LacI/PurR family transcriptional regulator
MTLKKKTVFTIRDVARLAQVSVSTVSNVLNGRELRMRAETLARVKQAIYDLQFQPNEGALRLKKGHSPMIGLLVPSIANPFYGVLARGIQEAAAAEGYGLLLCNTNGSAERERSYAQAFMAQGVRGVIVGSALQAQEHLVALIERGLAIVNFDRMTQHDVLPIDFVSLDNRRAGEMAAEHLLELGHRRIVFVSGPLLSVSRIARFEGVRDACRKRDVTFEHHIGDASETDTGRPISELGFDAACELREQQCDATAFIAVNDMYAIGLMAGFRQCGYKIPEDISVVGIDDLFLCRYFSPPLSSVRQPLEEMAEAAVKRLVGRIENRDEAPHHLIFAPEFVLRESTAAPRKAMKSPVGNPVAR